MKRLLFGALLLSVAFNTFAGKCDNMPLHPYSGLQMDSYNLDKNRIIEPSSMIEEGYAIYNAQVDKNNESNPPFGSFAAQLEGAQLSAIAEALGETYAIPNEDRLSLARALNLTCGAGETLANSIWQSNEYVCINSAGRITQIFLVTRGPVNLDDAPITPSVIARYEVSYANGEYNGWKLFNGKGKMCRQSI